MAKQITPIMIEIIISDTLRNKANKRLDNFNFGNRNLNLFGSERDRTLIGYIGELMVMGFLGIEQGNDDYNYDIIYQKKRLEVKSISCKFKPHLDYLCTVNSYDLNGVHKQNADYYVFTRIINDMTKGWILGFINCDDFFTKGKFIKKGSTVVPGVKFWKANATVLPINQLINIDSLKSYLGSIQEGK